MPVAAPPQVLLADDDAQPAPAVGTFDARQVEEPDGLHAADEPDCEMDDVVAGAHPPLEPRGDLLTGERVRLAVAEPLDLDVVLPSQQRLEARRRVGSQLD